MDGSKLLGQVAEAYASLKSLSAAAASLATPVGAAEAAESSQAPTKARGWKAATPTNGTDTSVEPYNLRIHGMHLVFERRITLSDDRQNSTPAITACRRDE